MYGNDGQLAMTRSFMYSPYEKIAAPEGAPPLKKLLSNSFQWTEDFIKKTTDSREALKEKYTEITF